MTAQYENINTISVVAMNCVGNSLPAIYIIKIGEPPSTPPPLCNEFFLNTSIHTDGCPIPTAPVSGTIGPVSSRKPGSKVTFQWDTGFTPTARMVATCLVNSLVWNPDSSTFVCNQAQGTGTNYSCC